MFHPKARHLALAASAALAISAGAHSGGTRPADTDATITTSKQTRAADLTTSDGVRSDRARDATPTTSNAPALPCQGDITGDRRVDVLDLMQVLMDWGTCASEPDLGSIGRTDRTGLSDLSGKASAGPSLDNGRRRPTADDRSTGLSDLSGKASAGRSTGPSDLSGKASAGPSVDNGGRRPAADDRSTGQSDLSGKASRRRPTADDRSTGVSDLSGKASAGPSIDNGGRRRGPTADDGTILGQVLPCRGDINGDGYVDARDMAAVLTNFGRSCP